MDHLIKIVCFAACVTLIKLFFNGGTNKHSPDLKDKVIIITGANTGIGFESAKEMAKLNPKVIVMACRD